MFPGLARLFIAHPQPQAPSEADAELVRHLKLGAIDIIASDDSDLLVLGAAVVLRK